MNIVLDTNVWVSALARPQTPPGRVMEAFLDQALVISTTDKLWNELLRAASYERVRRLFESVGAAPPHERLSRIRELVTFVATVEPTSQWVPGDKDDDWVVQCALTAQADRIVTGDKALLGLRRVEGVQIVTARELADDLEARERVTKRP